MGRTVAGTLALPGPAFLDAVCARIWLVAEQPATYATEFAEFASTERGRIPKFESSAGGRSDPPPGTPTWMPKLPMALARMTSGYHREGA